MKYFILCTLLLLSQVESGRNDNKMFPNLPFGEFRVFPKAILYCSSNRDTDIQANFYLNRRSREMTELRGNVTLKIPFDDSFFFHVNFAVKDSIGGWKDNAFFYKSDKVCSTIKHIMGIEWKTFLNNGGLMDLHCPVSPGVYVLKGYDVTNWGSNYNTTKIFYYGTYKIRVFISDKNDNVVACIMYVVDIKRPWETE